MSPLNFPMAHASAPPNTLFNRNVDDDESRTVFSIVTSCIFTLLLSMAFCLRPNIPSPKESIVSIFLTKVNIAFWFLVTPEFVLGWAYNQWFVGRKYAKVYQRVFVSFFTCFLFINTYVF